MGQQQPALPSFVIFEGVDGAGKTALSRLLADYYRTAAPDGELYLDNFPGSIPGTLGEWVYRTHHGLAVDSPRPTDMAGPALQLLHVAAHVDTILNRITPTLHRGGSVILDRYWWSTYAYSRRMLPPDKVWSIVGAERVFWRDLPAPQALYITRKHSLKADEIDPATHREIDDYYAEVVAHEVENGVEVHQVRNDGTLNDTFQAVLAALKLPPAVVAQPSLGATE